MTVRRAANRVVLAEPWLGGSHQAWAEGLARHSSHTIDVVGLPATRWRWRLRAGAAPLAEAVRTSVDRDGWPDVLLVSGLVDVAALLGHLRPPPGLPVVTYMHETQLLYPTSDGAVDADATIRNWSSWLASDEVWFNSVFHRDAVLAALPAWAADQPEPLDVELVVDRFDVVPVGVEPIGSRDPAATRSGPPVILWPHRWEHDKRPDVFARALRRLVDRGLDFRLVLAGEDPFGSPERSALIDEFAEHVDAVGPFDRAAYVEHLRHADIVVSCTDHEFFGIAVVEALLAGCRPVLPNALSYPELVPAAFHDVALYEPGTFGRALERAVAGGGSVDGLAAAMQRWTWPIVIADYDERLAAIADRGRRQP